jgi:hypothetical protein
LNRSATGVVSGFRREVDENCAVLGYYAASIGFSTLEDVTYGISLFRRAFKFTMCNGPTNALVCIKTLIQMSQIKTL